MPFLWYNNGEFKGDIFMSRFDKGTIQEKMQAEGKVKINDFDNIVKNYFKEEYDKEGYFAFIHVDYEFFDGKWDYCEKLGKKVLTPKYLQIQDLFPFFVEYGININTQMFCLEIPDTINKDNLEKEILKRVPGGLNYITKEEIAKILAKEGFEDAFFEHYFNSAIDYPDYNLYARPIALKVANSDEHVLIDSCNFPQNCTDTETGAMLDILYSKGQLPSRKVQYLIKFPDEQTSLLSNVWEEFAYDDKRFIRYTLRNAEQQEMTLSNGRKINNNSTYWIEVKPYDSNKGLYHYTGIRPNESSKQKHY